ncbi:MAG: RNA-binding protein [Meiothermus sp.]|uniref:RNA-binding protein n=1 Tax=Meiothermus sp. TaxID=1955249 RepID=UPI0025DA9298|nr:RNA-binding protein [Meiothermus sp.]MCS7057883.1 RNA-binding protein [Meiothermus sp.]MCS7194241.1 RNA-binding protein [Meiothermus sp.]MCX7740469.1 RNA-binding protein [Meiothermus sp.]MDW8090825.1 RNA-binding protein [Meiothermus sp.]MDW8480753.1 RNA-binding protein [Meiothermus sp.]
MLEVYVGKARGGRVVQTPFLEAEALEELRRMAQAEGLGFRAFGGLPLALRRVAVLHPSQVPEVSDPTVVLYLPSAEDPEAMEARLRAGVEPGLLGDLEPVEGGFLLAALPKALPALQALGLEAQPASPEQLPQARERLRSVVVPSLRVDVVGARGFGVSRNYFAQGVKAGKVWLRGRVASVKDELQEGDQVLAEGLGSLVVRRVLGQTKRGNVKLELEVRR